MTAPKITPHDVERAERLLRSINGGTDGHAATVLPTTRVLCAYRTELLAEFDSLTRRWCDTYGLEIDEANPDWTIVTFKPEHACACSVLTSFLLLVAKLRGGANG